MGFEVKGIISEIGDRVQVSEKFIKREFVITAEEGANQYQFTNYYKFQLGNDRCDLIDNMQLGIEVTVHFNIKGLKWTNKEDKELIFMNLEAWKIKRTIPYMPHEKNETPNNEIPNDDLPF